jgi:hypothetical protein
MSCTSTKLAHQGIQQQLPESAQEVLALQNQHDKVISVAILGGLHHDYRRAAYVLKSVFSRG